MFGHDDNSVNDSNQQADDNSTTTAPDSTRADNVISPAPAVDEQPSGAPATPFVLGSSPADETASDTPALDNPASTPANDDALASDEPTQDLPTPELHPENNEEISAPIDSTPPETTNEPTHDDILASVPSLSTSGSVSSDDLLNLKTEALKELSPLVDQLNQTPEEKFRTMMMMIQASDDDKLIEKAYAAAKDITDEKTRAQALLDIINEINYFTQQH